MKRGDRSMNICVVGTGYVGLVTGACFAERGHCIHCVDVNEAAIVKLKNGIMPIYEPGLEEMVWRNAAAGRLAFSTSLKEGAKNADICIIAVGTPSKENGEVDLQYVFTAAREIAETITGDCVIVVKSTVAVGTCRDLQHLIGEKLAERGLSSIDAPIVSNPEFLKEGTSVGDCMNPDRVVIGVTSARAQQIMADLYSSFAPPEKIVFMDPQSSEITKYASNAMLALRISFINEIALLCDIAGADVKSVKRGISLDSRIGGAFLNAGCGYGGSCFPKDLQALDQTGKFLGLEMKMAAATSAVNERQKKVLANLVVSRFGRDLRALRVAVLGLAFKPNTDDMRHAPAIPLIESLIKFGAHVVAVDPIAVECAKAVLPAEVEYAEKASSALQGADAAVLVTEWPEFVALDWLVMGERMRRKVLFDGRNVYDADDMKALGFEYYCIGRSCLVESCPC